ncbi:MAG: biotin transporter BioY [Acidobacteria bacterium]|nr:MAG: biotin transporter BioY [Acidobacteriota bacterium]
MATAIQRATLIDVIWPSIQGTRKLIVALVFSGIIALMAQVAIPLPFTPVPITGQTFAVLLAGALLGPRYGALTIVFYLLEGASGLPFFAGGSSGWFHLWGPTGGYLVAYIPAAYVVGILAERGWDRRWGKALLMMMVGEAIILSLGALWLIRYVPVDRVLMLGVIPFLPGDIVKGMLAAAVLPSGWKILARWP